MQNVRSDPRIAKRPDPEDEHRVIPFRPRTPLGSRAGQASGSSGQPEEPSPVRDLVSYEVGNGGEDNYRHRMLVNLAALAVTVVLAIGGAWLALQMADVRKKEDCVLSGRRNCMPIDVNTLKR
jgi:hypothetical protein